jgi:hypothetical protein
MDRDWRQTAQDFKADPSRESFLFTLKNPHNFPARKFKLKSERGDSAISCDSSWGPHFCDLGVSSSCNANARSFTNCFGRSYVNDSGLKGETFFTGFASFIVQEIEVFEIQEIRADAGGG